MHARACVVDRGCRWARAVLIPEGDITVLWSYPEGLLERGRPGEEGRSLGADLTTGEGAQVPETQDPSRV